MNKKSLILMGILVALTGCGMINRSVAWLTDYSIICVTETHVKYVQFTSGTAVLVDATGKPQSCN